MFPENGSMTMSPSVSPLWLRTESTLNLTCVSDGRTEISWYKNNVKMNIDSTAGFIMTTRQTVTTTTSNLWKVDVRISDAGTYSCYDNQQRHLHRTIDVRVLNVVGSDVTKPVGDSATLKCNPQNLKHEDFKRVEWRRNYDSLPSHQRSRVIKNDNSFSLKLTSLDQSDSGDYECIFTFETKTPDGLVQEASLSKRIRLAVQVCTSYDTVTCALSGNVLNYSLPPSFEDTETVL
ncbi:titin-like [Liolophura sinensis]|uniref:titin-like n=1 Tax=Liolophura sinensis TaxID=3198878 RepID=UPI003157F24B